MTEKYFDITILLGTESIDYPGDAPFRKETVRGGGRDARYTQSRLEMSAHAGTHIDLPAHFDPDAGTIENFGVADFIMPAVVVTVENPEMVLPEHVAAAHIHPGDAVLFRTENSTTGRCVSGVFTEKYVHLSPGAAVLCVEKKVRLAGIDFISVDPFGDEMYPAHVILSRAGVMILEGINLKDVPEGRYTLFCAPLKIAGGEASPVRAFLSR